MSELLQAGQLAAEEKPAGVKRVLVSIPNEGHTPVEAYGNRLVNMLHLGKLEERGKLLNLNPRYEFFFFTLGRMFTPVAREEAAKQAMAADMDYLFMIDDDMICPDDVFDRLVGHDVDIIGPLAFTRNPPHKPVIYSCIDGWDPVSQKDYFINHVVMNYPKNQLVECDAFGFGAALIKVDVLRKMQPPYFMSSCGTGEDILFCYNAKKYGARIFVDTATKLGHLSHPVQVTESYAEEFHKKMGLDTAKKYGEYVKYSERDRAAVLLGD